MSRIVVPVGRLREYEAESRVLAEVRAEMAFSEMTAAVGSAEGLLELIWNTLHAFDQGTVDCVNWNMVTRTIQVAIKQLDPVYAALGRLETLDRPKRKP